ncbi:hypothetical protein RFI_24056 [Reticulomyxa filosa]|uniref:tRNA (guanine-N(7)-)-methyltransferase n=1 Tax=Reticulomyxa filosa TaxID=46433 RepID=X6MH27_RETFI|nr:hypothetical protein RFI_24056 [Reticulomyxa filosa]|eukprot:ETO13318.1 hypothetical protein RFI_24056 [Reticulomyxa filosa]
MRKSIRTNGSKKTTRLHAHVNPLSDRFYELPLAPSQMNWHKHFPGHFPEPGKEDESITKSTKHVVYVDVGCGFGGMEIRDKVVEIVQKSIMADKKTYNNVSVIHTNAMKYLCYFFEKGSLEALFFCFPDPHFKKANVRRRIITEHLLDYYAYVLKEGGIIYNITDVKDLYEWTRQQFENKKMLFEEVLPTEFSKWAEVDLIMNKTNEAKRVTEKGGEKFCCIYRKRTILG